MDIEVDDSPDALAAIEAAHAQASSAENNWHDRSDDDLLGVLGGADEIQWRSAAALLLRRGSQAAFEAIVEHAKDPDPAVRVRALSALSNSTYARPAPPSFQVSPAARALLFGLLDDADSQVTRQAAFAVANLRVEGWEEVFWQRLQDPEASSDWVPYLLALHGERAGELTAWIAEQPRLDRHTGNLLQLAERADLSRPARDRAVELLESHFLALPVASKEYTVYLARYYPLATRRGLPFLLRVAERNAQLRRAGQLEYGVYGALARVAPDRAPRVLIDALQSLMLLGPATEALEGLATPGSGPGFAKAVAEAIGEQGRARDGAYSWRLGGSAALRLVARWGGSAEREALADAIPSMFSGELAELVWSARGWALPDVLDGLVDAGLIAGPVDLEQASREEGRPLRSAADLMLALSIAENVLMFGGEVGMAPAPNDRLLHDFAEATSGDLALRCVYQRERNNMLDIGFIDDGRAYTVGLPCRGDWYAHDVVSAVANEALRRRGLQRRFVRVEGEPTYLYADPDLVRTAFRRYAIEIDEDHARGEGAPRWLRDMAREALMKA